jgi:biopolymer transport protein ExbD
VKRSRKKKRRTSEVPIASMGDIAFLLIIFFLLLSEFAKDKDLPIHLPASAQVEKTKNGVAARVAIDSASVIYVDGSSVSSAEDVQWNVKALLANTVADEQRHVQFKCDAALPTETFEPVLTAIAEAGGIIDAVGEKRE